MKFKLNDTVKIKKYDEQPIEKRTKSLGKLAGKNAKIVGMTTYIDDNGETNNSYVLLVQGYEHVSKIGFTDDMVEECAESEIKCKMEIVGDKAYIEITNANTGDLVAKKYGNIRDKTIIAQIKALSWAMKMIYEEVLASEAQ